jgi:ribosomal protein L31E
MKIKEPHDIFKSILRHLTDVPVKLDAAKACYALNDYFEKGITSNQIKVSPSITKYVFTKFKNLSN